MSLGIGISDYYFNSSDYSNPIQVNLHDDYEFYPDSDYFS